MVELVQAGRMPVELSGEFECSAQAIGNWVRQADLDAGVCEDGPRMDEREQLHRLRREVKQLRMEHDILKRAAAWFARESNAVPEKCSDS